MNGDIELLMRELKKKMDDTGKGGSDDDGDGSEATSATSLLLGQFGSNRTTH